MHIDAYTFEREKSQAKHWKRFAAYVTATKILHTCICMAAITTRKKGNAKNGPW
jgi:hypothetical protein